MSTRRKFRLLILSVFCIFSVISGYKSILIKRGICENYWKIGARTPDHYPPFQGFIVDEKGRMSPSPVDLSKECSLNIINGK